TAASRMSGSFDAPKPDPLFSRCCSGHEQKPGLQKIAIESMKVLRRSSPCKKLPTGLPRCFYESPRQIPTSQHLATFRKVPSNQTGRKLSRLLAVAGGSKEYLPSMDSD